MEVANLTPRRVVVGRDTPAADAALSSGTFTAATGCEVALTPLDPGALGRRRARVDDARHRAGRPSIRSRNGSASNTSPSLPENEPAALPAEAVARSATWFTTVEAAGEEHRFTLEAMKGTAGGSVALTTLYTTLTVVMFDR